MNPCTRHYSRTQDPGAEIEVFHPAFSPNPFDLILINYGPQGRQYVTLNAFMDSLADERSLRATSWKTASC